jgi:hypothetical protein
MAKPPAKRPAAKIAAIVPQKAAARKPAAAKKGKTFRQRFLDELKEQSGGEQKLLSNSSIREALGWSDAVYNRTKQSLKDENAIVVGKGRGGTVGLAEDPSASKEKLLKVFISYSHGDEKYKNLIIKHIRPLKRLRLIEEWHDRKILAGESWGNEIAKNLDSADIVIALISADFINSNYCYDIEMERALQRHDEEEAKLIPVIISPCLWKYSPFAKIQALPTDGKPVVLWDNEDEAMVLVAEAIKTVAERVLGIA